MTDIDNQITIFRDCEYDECMEEVMDPLDVYWAKGVHDDREFLHAVMRYCLDEHDRVPRIDEEDRVQVLWQHNVAVQGGVEYRRYPEDELPAGLLRRVREGDLFKVTLIDLERRKRHGATKCSVNMCVEPWSSGPYVTVLTEGEDSPIHTQVQIWFCEKHRNRYPEPSYRVFMVPVGAEIVFPKAKDQSEGE